LGYSYWYSPYYSYWGNPYYGYGWNGYWSGYNNGYWNGYHDGYNDGYWGNGWYSNNNGNNDNVFSDVYYGHRGSSGGTGSTGGRTPRVPETNDNGGVFYTGGNTTLDNPTREGRSGGDNVNPGLVATDRTPVTNTVTGEQGRDGSNSTTVDKEPSGVNVSRTPLDKDPYTNSASGREPAGQNQKMEVIQLLLVVSLRKILVVLVEIQLRLTLMQIMVALAEQIQVLQHPDRKNQQLIISQSTTLEIIIMLMVVLVTLIIIRIEQEIQM
jgi:hypothetical protein